MDTSKQYIKMCDCPEIQEGWEHCKIVGDWYVVEEDFTSEDDPAHGFYTEIYINIIGSYEEQSLASFKTIWLPRQDQLIGMLNWTNARGIIIELEQYCLRNPDYMNQFNANKSMEQLWLAFVMWELHGKQWDGEKWI